MSAPAEIIPNVIRGTIFGAALTAAGVASPSIIVDQMALRQFHMLKVFLTASASSAIILHALSSRLSSPSPAPSSYRDNVVGGAMIGAGMALTGACPGTVMVQVAAGVSSAYPVLLGGLVGGTLHHATTAANTNQPSSKANPILSSTFSERSPVEKSVNSPDTVMTRLKLDKIGVLTGYEVLLVSVITVFSQIQNTPPWLLNPVVGGLAIGTAQLASVLLISSPLGVSTAFSEVGQWVWRSIDQLQGKVTTTSKPPTRSIQFATSLMLGTYLVTKFYPEFGVFHESVSISPALGFLGGIVMIYGARLAKGCTSGHGISGMSRFSVSSIVSVASMFGAGIATALILQR